MQEFQVLTLASLFIQNLLSNTPLPIYNTAREGDYILKNHYYIFNHEVIYCTKTGFIGIEERPPLLPNIKLCPDIDLYPSDGALVADYKNILRFEFGKYYPKLTYLYRPKTNLYDSETHYLLGKYLRCIRDLYKIDYMPFYNCYSNLGASNLVITDSKVVEQNTNKPLIIIPILYNKTYTFTYRSSVPIVMRPFKYNYKLISDKISVSNETGPRYTNNYKIYGINNGSVLNTFGVYTKDPDEAVNDRYLYMGLLSNINIQSLSVIEGVYSQAEHKGFNCVDYYIENQNKKKYIKEIPEPVSKLSLLDRPEKSYAFSDRLIEGLLHNIINRQDEIFWNVKEVQKQIGKNPSGIWDDKLRIKFFDEYLADRKVKSEDKFDITGNIDKDIEFWLWKGMN